MPTSSGIRQKTRNINKIKPVGYTIPTACSIIQTFVYIALRALNKAIQEGI
ncbi:MAG: hypothetical protein GY938_33020 [Ketobacter sp.]|nr:hypothetical protein [Ketobacter sp.]